MPIFESHRPSCQDTWTADALSLTELGVGCPLIAASSALPIFFGLRSYREMLAADASPLVMGFAVAAYSIEKAKASGASQENREDDSGGAAPQGNPKN